MLFLFVVFSKNKAELILLMENAAAKVLEDIEIVEELGKVDPGLKITADTDIPNPNNTDKRKNSISTLQKEDVANAPQSSSTLCCCFPEKDDNSGSEFQHETKVDSSPNCSTELKLFLDSPVYCIFIIVVSFSVFIILLVELFIDAELLNVEENETAMHQIHPNEGSTNVSVALHWFSFALLTVFFIEMIARVAVWRLNLLKDFISIFDAVVVFLAFLINLCVTLIDGAESPIDGISLIIILRLVRIHTLIKVKVGMVKKRKDLELERANESLYTANSQVTTLMRQIREKDYEIRQLQAYLSESSSSNDPRMIELMKSSSNNDEDLKGAAADSDLQMAIALSQQAFNEENGGVDNKAFTHASDKRTSDIDDELKVLVHHRPDRLNSEESNVESCTKMTSYMQDYFSKPIYDLASSELSVASESPGARRKSKNKTPIFNANSSNNFSDKLDDHQVALEMLGQGNLSAEPISICIDPTILQSTKDIGSLSEDPKFVNAKDSCGMQSNSTEDCLSNGSRSVISSPSDIVSFEDNNLDSDRSPKIENKILNSSAKNGGSSISSESGYLSEDVSHLKVVGKTKPMNNGSEMKVS